MDAGANVRAGYAEHAWLAALLPDRAHRVRVADRRLAGALEDSGAELVERAPDVEIGGPADLRGDAALAVVPLGRLTWGAGRFPARAAARFLASARVRIQAISSRRALERLGYAHTAAVGWDHTHELRVLDLPAQRLSGRPVVEYLPRCRLVFGWRTVLGRSLLRSALDDASAASGSRLEPTSISARGGFVVAIAGSVLLRVAVGPARGQIASQLSALDALRASRAPDVVAARVPWPAARGRSGLADWSLESLLPGRPARPPLSHGLLAQCLDFLVALHSIGHAGEHPSCADASAVLAAACGPAEAEFARELARRLDRELAPVPRGFGHGDFFSGNLLVEDERLLGVVDWDAGGPGRLPLLDLLQLTFLARHRPSDLSWGPTLVRKLLPWARRGGDDFARDYCRRVGLDPDPPLLEALVLAYWLERAAYQLRTHAERWDQRAWLDANIRSVIEHVRGAT